MLHRKGLGALELGLGMPEQEGTNKWAGEWDRSFLSQGEALRALASGERGEEGTHVAVAVEGRGLQRGGLDLEGALPAGPVRTTQNRGQGQRNLGYGHTLSSGAHSRRCTGNRCG